MPQYGITPDELKLYYSAGGSGSGASWVAIPKAREAACSASKDQLDAWTRGAGAFKAYQPGLCDLELTFTVLGTRDSDGVVDTVLAALIAAYEANTILGWAVKDGDITDTGSQGWEFDGQIFDMNRNEGADDLVTYEFTVRPSISSTAPDWVVTA